MSPPTDLPGSELARINATIAQRIRIELATQHKSIKALASESGIKPKTLARRLSRRNPTPFQPGELINVAAVLGVDLVTLTAAETEPNGGAAA